MAVLFDPADAYVRSVLDRAQNRGEITLAELEAIIKASSSHITPNQADVADTIDALAGMDIEIELVSRVRRRARMPVEIRRRAQMPLEILPTLGAAHGRTIHCSPAWRLWLKRY